MSSTTGNSSFSIEFIDLSGSPSSGHSINVLNGSSPPHPPSSPSPHGARRVLLPPPGPDYGRWCEAWNARFPNHYLCPDTARQRSWRWLYGYRLKKIDGQYVWVCYECVARERPARRSAYSFVASTGKSIEAHLRKAHQLLKTPSAKQIANGRISHGQITIREALGLNPSQNEHNYVLDQLKRLFDSSDSELLLMDWIIMDNLPFQFVDSERFRRYLKSVNPVAGIPTRQTVANLVTIEYQHAIPQVK
jgi:hypothetical protein